MILGKQAKPLQLTVKLRVGHRAEGDQLQDQKPESHSPAPPTRRVGAGAGGEGRKSARSRRFKRASFRTGLRTTCRRTCTNICHVTKTFLSSPWNPIFFAGRKREVRAASGMGARTVPLERWGRGRGCWGFAGTPSRTFLRGRGARLVEEPEEGTRRRGRHLEYVRSVGQEETPC